jgi:AcrR family transcriptional regulator
MAEIAAAAGLSVGQIYRFFENKEAVIGAITEQQTQEVLDIALAADGPTTARDTIRRLVAKGFDKLHEPGCAALMVEVSAEASRNPRVAEMVRKRDDQIRAVIEDLVGKAEPRLRNRADFAARAEMFCLWFEGAATRSIRHPDMDWAQVEKLQNAMADHLLAPAECEDREEGAADCP